MWKIRAFWKWWCFVWTEPESFEERGVWAPCWHSHSGHSPFPALAALGPQGVKVHLCWWRESDRTSNSQSCCVKVWTTASREVGRPLFQSWTNAVLNVKSTPTTISFFFLQAHLNEIEIATNYPFMIESKAGLKDSYFNDLEMKIPTCPTSVWFVDWSTKDKGKMC